MTRRALIALGVLPLLALPACRSVAEYAAVPGEGGVAKKDGGDPSDAAQPVEGGTGVAVMPRLMGGEGDDVANGVAVDTAGNIYVVGSTRSEQFALGDGKILTRSLVSNLGVTDLFVVSFSPEGVTRWAHRVGGQKDSVARAIVVCADRVVVAGDSASGTIESASLNVVPFTQSRVSGSANNLLVLAFDRDGKKVWGALEGGDGDEYGEALVCLPKGIIVVGESSSSVLQVAGSNVADVALGGLDYFVLGIPNDGQSANLGRLGGPLDERLTGASAFDLGGGQFSVYLSGYADSGSLSNEVNETNGALFFGHLNPSGPDPPELVVAGGQALDRLHGVASDGAGRPVVVGDTESTMTFGMSYGGMDVVIGRVSGATSLATSFTTIGGTGDDSALAVAPLGVGEVVVVGESSSNELRYVGTGSPFALEQRGQADALVFVLADSTISSVRTLGGSGRDVARGAAALSSTGRQVVVVGEAGGGVSAGGLVDLGGMAKASGHGRQDAFVTVLTLP